MSKSNWTPSIVPRADDHDVYLVVDDLGRLGRVWREADYEATNYETVVSDLLTGQYNGAVQVVCFNSARVGRATSPTILPRSFAGVAICNFETCPPASKTSSNATKATGDNCH
jgi:hypothetical protein